MHESFDAKGKEKREEKRVEGRATGRAGAKSAAYWTFWGLNCAQFLGALNDNIFKLLLVFFLINFQGEQYRDQILALSGILFVLPFILFSSFAGKLADNYSKTRIFQGAKVLEILVMLLGVYAFAQKSVVLGYGALFAMALQSTIFGPSKLGLIPELFKREDIPRINGYLSLFVYLGITLGSTFASALSDWSQEDFVFCALFCVLIACIGTLASLFVPYSTSSAQGKVHSANVIEEVRHVLRRTSAIDKMHLMLLSYGLFYLFASYAQLSLVSFAMDAMGRTKTAGGYLNTFLGLGIGIGSFLGGSLARGRIRLDLLPLAGTGVGAGLIVLYFSASSLLLVSLWIAMIGVFGGLFVVPIDSFFQAKSPQEDRGEVVAVSNIFAFIGVLFGSALIFLFGQVVAIPVKKAYFLTGSLTIICSHILSRFLGKKSAIKLESKK